MTSDIRRRAIGLLDAAGVGTEHDATAEHVELAARFVGSFRDTGGRGPLALARALCEAASGTGRDAIRKAAEFAKLTHYPLDAFAWAWADPGIGPGQLDRRLTGPGRAGHPWDSASVTAFGGVLGWWMPPKRPRGIVVLSSDTGPGKTVAAVYLAIQQGGRFIRAADLGEMALGKAEDKLAELSQEDILIVDELGRESDIRPTPQRVTDLFGVRFDRGLTTLATTQLLPRHEDPANSFVDRYGHHLLDRIERGGGAWIDIKAPSRRGQGDPCLDGLIRSCEIADLVPRVITATAARGGSAADVNRLQALLGITDDQIEQAAAARDEWAAPLLEQAAAVGGIAGSIVAASLAGTSTRSVVGEPRRLEVANG